MHSTLYSLPNKNDPENLAWDPEILAKIKAAVKPGDVIWFDADGTIWADDVIEAFFRWLVAKQKLKNVDYNQDLFGYYEEMSEMDAIKAYRWIVTCLAGIKEIELQKWAAQFFQEYFLSRIYICQKKLIEFFQGKQCDIWIISASHQWIVKAGAAFLGIDEDHVLGVRLVVKDGILTDEIEEPFTYAQGKVDAAKKYIGKEPALVFGDSLGDLFILRRATKLKVFISHDKFLQDVETNAAIQAGCLAQYLSLQDPLMFEPDVTLDNTPKNLYQTMP